MDSILENVVTSCRTRAENLYDTRQGLCSEAVTLALNNGLGGGLSDSRAVGISAGFAASIGDSGCLCGAVSGAVLCVGLFLGEAGVSRKTIRRECGDIHEQFRSLHKSTCCRVLTRKFKDARNGPKHRLQCSGFTGECAELAARAILRHRPELLTDVDSSYLHRRDSFVGGIVRAAVRALR